MTLQTLEYFMKVPTHMFLGNRGLANVVYLLEQQFGTEEQDMTISGHDEIRAW